MKRDTFLGAACLFAGGGVWASAGGWVGFLGAGAALLGLALLMWTVKR